MLAAAARRSSGALASISIRSRSRWRCASGSQGTRVRAFASEPHNDDWQANFEDLMAMEDSYGSGVEDLSSAAAEMAGARMAEQKRLQEEMRRLRGIQPGDRVKIKVRLGAPYPEVVKRFHYTSPFGGAGLGHVPGVAQVESQKHGTSNSSNSVRDSDLSNDSERDTTGTGTVDEGTSSVDEEGTKKMDNPSHDEKGEKRRWKTVVELGYVVCVRGNRVGVKRNGHLEDTVTAFPTYPKKWVEVLDIGEMWEMKTGPRNMGAFASDEDYAQAREQWAAATATVASADTQTKAKK